MIPAFLIAPPETLIAAAFAGLMGLLVGSFLNVVIYRIPEMMQRESANYIALEAGNPLPHKGKFNLFVPRSACPYCRHKISALENIPVISYVFLGGKCRGCKVKIPLRYPLIELMTGILSAYVVWQFGSGLQGLASLFFIWILISLAFIDLDTQLLPDDLNYLLMWGGLLINLRPEGFVSLSEAVIGAAAGYMALWSIYWAFKITTGKEGMGYGDFKLLAALGAWFGWKMLPIIILLSSAVGAIVGIVLIIAVKHKRDVPIPFGPYLAGAGLLALIMGESLQQILFRFIA